MEKRSSASFSMHFYYYIKSNHHNRTTSSTPQHLTDTQRRRTLYAIDFA